MRLCSILILLFNICPIIYTHKKIPNPGLNKTENARDKSRWDTSWYKPSKKKIRKDRKLTKLSSRIKKDPSCQCGLSPLKTKIVNGQETPINKGRRQN